MTIYTTNPTAEYNDGSWHTIPDSAILEDPGISGSSEMGLADNGVAFGDEAITRCSIPLKLSAVASLDFARLPVRVTFQINAGSQVAFVGEVADASGDLDTVVWECEGLLQSLPGRTRDYYSPLRYRRPPFTKTTASSIEDPDDVSYQGGLGNEVLWRAGLRPYEQAGSYPGAVGYYSFVQAIRAPDWSWVAGENGYEELRRLARAVGGQIGQGLDGVIRYTQPLTMVGSVAQTFTIADFTDLDWKMAARDQYAKTFTQAFTPRTVQPTQRIIEDTTYRVVAAGASLTIDLEPQWPLYSVVLDGGTLKADNIIAAFFDGRQATYDASTGFTTVTTIYAQRIRVVVTNNASLPMQISKILIDGRPVAAGETQTVTVGSGDPARQLEDNVFVQNKAHATALATMALSFYGVARKVRTLREMVYNTSRVISETVALTVSELGLTAAPHIILSKAHQGNGETMDLDLVDASGLPALADYWLIQSTSQSGTKKVAW